MLGIFDPNNASKEEIKILGEHIERYVDNLLDVMIIPDEEVEKCEESITEGLRRVRKLIKKMKKGDKSIFVELDDDEF